MIWWVATGKGYETDFDLTLIIYNMYYWVLFYLVVVVQSREKLVIGNLSLQLDNLPPQTGDKIRGLLRNVTDLKKVMTLK